MRVGIGIILSVLSCSVLAAVIPDYDSHGILLVRRAVNPDNRVVLWKRADEEQAEPGPSSSEAGAGASTETDINSKLDDLDQLRDYTRRLYKLFTKNWNGPGKKAIRWSDKKSIKATIKKVARVTEENPLKMCGTELKKITDSASTMHHFSANLNAIDEKILISMVKSTSNEKHIEVTKTRISEMEEYHNIAYYATYIVILPTSTGRITFKEKTPSRFATFKSQAKSRLGFKKKPPTDETSDEEPLD
ncbi:hypothetical protein BASA50_011114 [Batrachochytrium salamandrivorans]|uniref:Uncharacterized protein n=1 Tax=Batrachochytrium salamandrivorans TaxID=1357716 RepID=A0ABQ8EXN8_9FUNG|nr:hypothetical protein BASA50_011114 [Batrachochytrium salamandrivorans]